MKQFIIALMSVMVSLTALDYIWLTKIVKSFVVKSIGHLMGPFRAEPAVVFYIIYSVALTVIVILPAIENNNSLQKTLLLGALFGLAAYGAYDLTNHATLRNWPLALTVLDMTWGATVTAIASALATHITKILM